jgi:outer membrane biosynthesis protein TonB
MSSSKNKNIQAASYTILVLAALFLLFFFVSWTRPLPPPPQKMEDIEVELGDAPEGAGSESAGASSVTSEPQPETSPQPVTEKNIATNDADNEAPAIVSKPKAEVKKVLPVVEAPPTPKYLYKGQGSNSDGQGTGNEGKERREEGVGLVQGKVTGNEGQGIGSGGLSIVRGLQGRKINRYPSFEDDFNENAKVAVDVRVDQNGNVTSANIQPKGTTTGNPKIKSIALQKAKLLKFNTDSEGAEEEVGTVVFVFRVRD